MSEDGERGRPLSRRGVLRTLPAAGVSLSLAGCSSALFGPPTATPDWTVDVEGAAAASPPAVAGDSVVVGAQDKAVHLLATGDGATQQRAETGGAVEARPVVPDDDTDDGTVHVHSTDGDLYAVTREDGITWTVEDDPVDAPLGRAGDVVVRVTDRQGGDSEIATGYDATTGEQRWTHPGNTYRLAGLTPARTVLPVSDSGASDSHRAIAVDNETGTVAWRTDQRASYPTLDADADRTVVAWQSEGETTIAGYATADGTRQWETALDSSLGLYNITHVETNVYVVVEDGDDEQVVALDRANGGIDWRASVGNSVRASAVTDEVVHVASWVQRDDQTHIEVVALSHDGTRRWATVTDGGDPDAIAVTESAVVVNAGRSLRALDVETGERQWQYEPDDASRLGIDTNGERVFVSHRDRGRIVRLSV